MTGYGSSLKFRLGQGFALVICSVYEWRIAYILVVTGEVSLFPLQSLNVSMPSPSNVGKACLHDYNEPNLVITFVCLMFNLKQRGKFDYRFTRLYDHAKYTRMWISCAVSCRAAEHWKMSGGSGLYLSDSSCKRSNDLLLEGFVTLTSAKPQAFLRRWYWIIDSILPYNSLLRFRILPGVELLCFTLLSSFNSSSLFLPNSVPETFECCPHHSQSYTFCQHIPDAFTVQEKQSWLS